MYFDAPVKNDRLVAPLSLNTSIALAAAALIVLTFFAQFIIDAAAPAATHLLTFIH